MGAGLLERLREPREALGGVALALGLGGFAAFLGSGLLEPSRSIALLAGLVFVGVAILRLPVALGMLVFFTFFEAVPGGYNLVRGATAVVIAVWLVRVTNRAQPPPSIVRSHPWLSYALGSLVAWGLVSSLWAHADAGEAIGATARLAPAVALAFVTFAAVRSRADVRAVLWGYVLGGLASVAVGVLAGFGGAEADEDRYGGVLGDPNFLAAALVAGVVFAAFLLPGTRSVAARLLLAIAIVANTVGLVLTESRGGFVALGAATVLVLTVGGPLRRWAVAAIVAVAAAAFVVAATSTSVGAFDRVSNLSADGGSGRTDVWSVAWEVAKDEPVVGVGAGNFRLVEPAYASRTINLLQPSLVFDKPRVAHNMYLEVLAEQGVVGLALFLFALGVVVLAVARGVRRLARAGDREGELLARAALVGTGIYLVAFVFLSGQYEKPLWILFALGLALNAQLAPDDGQPPAQTEPGDAAA